MALEEDRESLGVHMSFHIKCTEGTDLEVHPAGLDWWHWGNEDPRQPGTRLPVGA